MFAAQNEAYLASLFPEPVGANDNGNGQGREDADSDDEEFVSDSGDTPQAATPSA
jgi:hypothetical protein